MKRLLRQPLRLVRHYPLLTLVAVTSITGLILEITKQHTALHWVLGSVCWLAVLVMLWDTWETLRSGSFGINVLAITAVVTALLLHEYWAALAVVAVTNISKTLERWALKRAQGELLTVSAHRARFVRLTERYSLPFSFMVAAIAIAVWVLSGHVVRFLEVIIVATPFPLIVAAPIALIGGLARANHYGIMMKSAATLERLADAETVVFAKTGTLTQGELAVSQITTFNGFSQGEVLQWAAGLERTVTHPIAQAIMTEAETKKVKPFKVKQLKVTLGQGIVAEYKGDQIVVGRLDLLQAQNVDIPPAFKPAGLKQTTVLVAVSGKLAGAVSLSDTLHSTAKTAVEQLGQLGIKRLILMSGDHLAASQSIAKQLGIEQVQADATPANKLHFIESVKQRPSVFVGDGAHDALALNAADVGIAIGANDTATASEAADVVIAESDLGHVVTAFSFAKRSLSIAQRTILIGVVFDLVLIGVFATGKLSPVVGAFAPLVIAVIVVFSGLRVNRLRLTP
jgi:P-type E1-E2 ATPase